MGLWSLGGSSHGFLGGWFLGVVEEVRGREEGWGVHFLEGDCD